MNDSVTAILALVLGLIAVIAVTVWWPNPLDRESSEEPLARAAPVPRSSGRDVP